MSLSLVVDDPTAAGNILQSDIDKIYLWAQNGWSSLTLQNQNHW